MSDKDIRNFLESFDEVEEVLKQYKEYIDRQSLFTVELIGRIGELTYEYFSEKTPCPGLIIQLKLKENELYYFL